jgi:cysteinyl-tRNA synthetase
MRFDAMDLKLYDTLTREKRVFAPLDPANVRMYVCGPTVYDFAHIGNARPVIVFDVLFRLLRHIYGEKHVTYVRNITDVDDKINARAAEEYPDLPLNEAIRKVTEKTDRQFHEDVAALGCLPPTVEPRATEHIAEMRALIDRLVASDNAYVAEDNVLFSVPSMADYGQLSKRPLDEMVAGARVEVAPYKRDAMDFVLWKPSKLAYTAPLRFWADGGFVLQESSKPVDTKSTALWFWAMEGSVVLWQPWKQRDPAWASPCEITQPGRPGWHIECSAMADKWLWTEALPKLSNSGRAHPHQFDIHGGGIDLLFPHHEDEIAQSRCAFHTPTLANYWVHNGFLQVEGEKMSKSLGNFVTIRELFDGWKGRKRPGQIVRLAMLATHYRRPIDWTLSALEEAETVHADWSAFCANAPITGDVDPAVLAALADDLNTPKAISELHALRKSGNPAALRASLSFLGVGLIFNVTIEEKIRMQLEVKTTVVTSQDVAEQRKKIEALIVMRNAARREKNFAESDRIRDELAAMGVVLKDSKDGTTWEIAR